MALIGVGCTKEDRSECDTPILLQFKAIINVNGENVEADKDDVKELILYVFDAQEEFLESHYAEIGSTISLSYPSHKELHLVCWGNSSSDQQTLPQMEVGDKLGESLITLKTEGARAQEMATTHPDDLFHSSKRVIIDRTKPSTIEMVLYHKIASVSITASGLSTLSTKADGEYKYVLRSGKKHINFTGNTEGGDVHHHQAAEFKNGIHESGIFNILPYSDDAIKTNRVNSPATRAAGDIEVDIYKGSELIHTVKKDSEGNTIKAKEGQLLNVRADFNANDGSVSVSVAITAWGEKKVWKDFD